MFGSQKSGRKTTQRKPTPRTKAPDVSHAALSVDRIDNGYLVTRTEQTKAGIKQTRTYSKDAPNLGAVIPKG